jgi:uncharacterized membrane protein/uncharacterized BrkB/YihY/UPF0761 family membrane protein
VVHRASGRDVVKQVAAGTSDESATPGRAERIKARVAATQARVDDTRQTVPAIDAAFVVRADDRQLAGNLLACAVAYRLFLWALPVALLLAALLGFLNAAHRDAAGLAENLGLGNYVVTSVNSAADQARSSRFGLLLLALIGLYSASSGGAKTMSAIHSMSWGLPIERVRSSWRAALGFAGFGFGLLALGLITNWARSQAGIGTGVRLGMVVMFAGYWLCAMVLLPHGDVPWYRLIPGALLMAAGVQVLHLITVFYLAGKVATSSAMYGALGAAATILLWLYFVGRLVVLSTVTNATLWRRLQTRSNLAPTAAPRPSPTWGEATMSTADEGRRRPHTDDGRPAHMATLSVWKFDTATGADEAIATLELLSKEELIKIHDAATVTWPAGKKKPKTHQLAGLAGAGALGGAFWGLLFGLLFFIPFLGMAVGAAVGGASGALTDVGIDDDFIASIRAKVQPGTSALFVLTSDAVLDKVEDAFKGQNVELIHTNLSSDEEQRLRDAFADD